MAEEKKAETEIIPENPEINLADVKMTDVAKAKIGKKFGSVTGFLKKVGVTVGAAGLAAITATAFAEKKYAKSEPKPSGERYAYIGEADVEVIGETEAPAVSKHETEEEV